MKKGDLLYLRSHNATDTVNRCISDIPVREIRAAGWDLHVVTDTKDVVDLIKRHDFSVGMTLIEPDHEESIRQWVETFYANTDCMEWVALVSPANLHNSTTCKLVTDYFYDYHSLPADPHRLLMTLGHARGMADVTREALNAEKAQFCAHDIVGTGPVMLALFRTIRKVAAVDAPVLITGESGTGKELIALAIHERSNYSGGKFVAVNCGALPAGLIQAELFGYEKGAFTGAHRRKIGRIESAAGGTIFLDEIGDLPLDLQVNLLRFLQDKNIQRLGGIEDIHVDARVIAATHIDLEKAVAEGRFREDLYYRLSVLMVNSPPLREREADIELLANFFFKKFSKKMRGNAKGFSQKSMLLMNQYHWPGNIREMINRIQRAIVMSEGRLITPVDLGLERRKAKRSLVTLNEARGNAEKTAIKAALYAAGDNVSEAARMLEISRVSLYRLIDKYGINTRNKVTPQARIIRHPQDMERF